MKFQIKNLSVAEFKDFLKDLTKSDIAIEKSEETFSSLKNFFDKKTVAEDNQYFFTFFQLYADLVWRSFARLEPDQVAKIFARQVVVALLLDYDIKRTVVQYLYSNTISVDHLEMLFTEMKQKLLESEAVVGYDGERAVTVADIVKIIRGLREQNKLDKKNSSDLLTVVDNLILSRGADKIKATFTDDTKIVAKNFVDLISWFIVVDEKKINEEVLRIVDPEKARVLAEVKKLASAQKSIAKGVVKKPSSVNKPDQKLTYPQIQTAITKKINSVPQENRSVYILTELDGIATKQNDAAIRELYYFNEQTGKFEWNETLLKQ